MRPLTAIKIATPTAPITYTSETSASSPLQYRIEERTRTVFVTTDVHPSQWDPQSINKMFQVNPEEINRTNSFMSERHIAVYPPLDDDTSYRPRSEGCISLPATPLPSRASSCRGQTPRSKILFYHSHDPHYGFTNFSPHAVYYRGKRYPTSEHLFQSFKVRVYQHHCFPS